MAPLAISVVMPVYNGERYLRQAILSALDQTLPPLEILVIDDGSTDSSREIAQKFSGRVRLLTQRNQGPSAARNLGTRAARGEWIAFLDADDVWLPEKLALQEHVLQAFPDAGLVYTGRTELYADGRTLDVPAQSPEWVRDRLTYENPLFPSTVLARRSLLLEHPWNETFRSSEDWALFYRLSRSAPFAVVPEPTTIYRVHGESLTHTDWKRVLAQAQVVAESIQSDFRGAEKERMHRRVNGRLYASAAIAARAHGSPEYLRYIVRSLVSWPRPEPWPARYKLFAKMLQQKIQSKRQASSD